VVIGSGPNGLVAAVTLARAGWDVLVLERSASAGGAIGSAELTVPGFVHDPYSAFYGLLHASPVFDDLDLSRHLMWADFDVPVAAAVSPNACAAIHRDPEDTVSTLGERVLRDGEEWEELVTWWSRVGSRLLDVMLSPIPSLGPALALARATGRHALDLAQMLLAPMDVLARERFTDPAARALLASGASHADVPVNHPGSVPAALVLALVAQTRGMPVPVGGAERLADALAGAVREAGGTVRTDSEVTRVVVEGGRATGVETEGGEPVRARRAVLADTGPRALFGQLTGTDALPTGYLAGLRRFRYGTGVFKIDLALDGPPPWSDPLLARAGVVHLTGDLAAMARASFEATNGVLPSEPMLIVGQQSLVDPSRAPKGGHTLWVETHVPPRPEDGDWRSQRDRFTDVVLRRLEAHAPGLSSRIVGSSVRAPNDFETENPNLVGGDLGAGSSALDQQLVFRPVPGWFRHRTPVRGLYLCSASTHPGGAVHGMAGRNCARRVLADGRLRRI
jgi:phytoene dehydrogenase-like protein